MEKERSEVYSFGLAPGLASVLASAEFGYHCGWGYDLVVEVASDAERTEPTSRASHLPGCSVLCLSAVAFFSTITRLAPNTT